MDTSGCGRSGAEEAARGSFWEASDGHCSGLRGPQPVTAESTKPHMLAFAVANVGLANFSDYAYYEICLSIGCSFVPLVWTQARRTLELFVEC